MLYTKCIHDARLRPPREKVIAIHFILHLVYEMLENRLFILCVCVRFSLYVRGDAFQLKLVSGDGFFFFLIFLVTVALHTLSLTFFRCSVIW